MAVKRIALLAFPKLTFLDLVGTYDALRRVAAMGVDPEVTHRIIGTEAEIVDDCGLAVRPDAVYEDLAGFDLLFVPGGIGTRTLMHDARLLVAGEPAFRGAVEQLLGGCLGHAGCRVREHNLCSPNDGIRLIGHDARKH
jgi:putative intracellular protease/amidase